MDKSNDENMDIRESFHYSNETPASSLRSNHFAKEESYGLKTMSLLLYPFSKIYAVSSWILGLKWYKMMFIVIVGLVVFVMAESIMEQRRENRKQQKEGMQSSSEQTDSSSKTPLNDALMSDKTATDRASYMRNDGLKGIMQKNKSNKTDNNKKVKFDLDEEPVYPRIYDLVVKPSVYSFFRNLGFR